MRLMLVCSADTPDFDLWAQVMLVSRTAPPCNSAPDIRRARFRDGSLQRGAAEARTDVEIPFEFNWTAWRIPAGARLRLVITPLNSPNYQKNYNTGGRIGYENPADARIAHIRIYHDARTRAA